jgi:pimeloyl-ACP methyl ester carboxylesterase
MPPDPSVVLVEGPWTHRDVAANGARFHVAELGEGPLVLLLHGFPQFWWCFRHQLTGLAAAGFRVAAADLRGYGASDKTPRGYDAFTLSADVAGLVRSLGERRAVIVGHDWGGFLGWVVAAVHPDVVAGLVPVSMPHPHAFRRGLLTEPRGQLAASRYMLPFQVPWWPERRLVAHDAAAVGALLRRWGGPGFPDADADRRYRTAAQIPGVVHSALEYYRWVLRSQLRPDGARFGRALAHGVAAPVLQIHGCDDPCTLLSTARGNERYVRTAYRLLELPGVGHFPAEEAPEAVTAAIAGFAREHGGDTGSSR